MGCEGLIQGQLVRADNSADTQSGMQVILHEKQQQAGMVVTAGNTMPLSTAAALPNCFVFL